MEWKIVQEGNQNKRFDSSLEVGGIVVVHCDRASWEDYCGF